MKSDPPPSPPPFLPQTKDSTSIRFFFSKNVDTKHGLYEKENGVQQKKKQFRSVQFKNTNEFSIQVSLPELPCLLSFLPYVVFGTIERDFSEF